MNYSDFTKRELERIGALPVMELLRTLEGKTVLVYSHDDPDGLTSAAIFRRLAEKLGIACDVKIPPTMELEEGRLAADLGSGDYGAVFVLDKATMGYYDGYHGRAENFVVIDHHPLQGKKPENIMVVNPQLHGDYKSCSTSFLVHMIAANMEKSDIYDDFLALVGLKGDWAVEPATDMVSDYVRVFYEEKISGVFAGLVKKIESRPTMFECRQREKTTLLNQIAELYFALGGGGFQYFYNGRDKRLEDMDQAIFAYETMLAQSRSFSHEDWKSLDDFIEDTADPVKVRMIYGFFMDDWDKTIGRFSNSLKLTRLGNTDVYLFIGYDVTLMPMAGSVYLYSLGRTSPGGEILFIMVNSQPDGGVHFSVRGTGAGLHSGKICARLAGMLSDKYGHADKITGGGHPFAAECRTRSSGVSLAGSLEMFMNLVTDMEEKDSLKDLVGGQELGLEYLKKVK
ncbi:MAG: DHH family phosphoesterase [Elusimicrobia bacterium]|nr:DHH family phosphoesterase [Elusimicrobiota bacterium]